MFVWIAFKNHLESRKPWLQSINQVWFLSLISDKNLAGLQGYCTVAEGLLYVKWVISELREVGQENEKNPLLQQMVVQVGS